VSTTTRRRPGIDPRLRARRIEVRREEGRRRLRRLTVLAGVVGAVALAFAVTRSPLLDVDRVDVAGVRHTPPEVVRDAAGLERGDALLYADLRAARRAVERLPWVAEARLSRHWPGTVRIAIDERIAAGAVPADGGGWVLADGDGRLLEYVEELPAGLVRLDGVASVPAGPPGHGALAGDDARRLLGVAARLPAALRPAVASASMGADGIELGLALPDGVAATVRFGPPELVEEKLLALAALLSGADLAGATSIDVRVPSVPVVARG